MKIAGVLALLLWLCVAGFAQTNSYTVTPIVNNTQDSYLVNPWGISRPISSSVGENEWWVSDEMTGFTTLYYANQKGQQSLAPLVISIPSASGTGVGSPTGTAFNPNLGPGPSPENFAFATLDGLIANWKITTGTLAVGPLRSPLQNWLFSAVNSSGAVSPVMRARPSSTPVSIPGSAARYRASPS